jgi:hypothetical protein
MSKVIKTNLELDNSGTKYNNGSVITRKTQYLEPLTKETAKNYFLAGHDIYFVYNPDNNIQETWIKLCDDIDYLEDHYAYNNVCGVLLNKHMLCDSEYAIVNKLAGLSGMACWFMLVANGNEWKVHDVEDNVDMSLAKGIKMLSEGITSMDDYSCTDDEKTAFKTLCERLNINYNT